MKLYKTVDKMSCLRIESDNGVAITINKERTYGHILSVFVPKSDRGAGVGRELVLAAEQELAECGIQILDADFSDALDNLAVFFEHLGFSCKPGVQILSAPLEKILSGGTAKKTLSVNVPGLYYVSLADISTSQWYELSDCFQKHHIRIAEAI